MRSTGFNLLDDSFLSIERPEDPWNIHLELQFEGQVDPERLRQALLAAIARHPMARARVAPFAAHTQRYRWLLPDLPDHIPLSVFHAATEAELQAHRDRLVSIQVPATLSPPFLCYLVQCDDRGDVLLISLNHVVADGLSTIRLLNSVLRAYAGEDDPVPDFDPLAVRDLKKLAGSRSLKESAERFRMLAERLVQAAGSPVRVQGQTGQARPAEEALGYGCVLLGLSAEDTAAFMARREKPATINDMLIAAMLLSIRAWNAERGGRDGRLSTMMPVNLRPRDWWFEVFGNFSSYVTVNLDRAVPNQFSAAVAAVCQQTQKLKEAGASGILIDVLDIPKLLPSVLKSRLKDITPTLGQNLVDSTWISNLGRLGEAPRMGEAGAVTGLYFSPPAPMPMGLSLGIAAMEDRLFLSFRYRNALLDQDAAQDFAQLCKAVMQGGGVTG